MKLEKEDTKDNEWYNKTDKPGVDRSEFYNPNPGSEEAKSNNN